MKKVILSVAVVAAILSANTAKAQLVDEQNVTVTMDLQPILQLGMSGSTNVDFVFDQISEYVGGITQYGATRLNVSSTVNWDLYAAGFSSNAAGAGVAADLTWDNQVVYGQDQDVNSTTVLPLTLLELHQDKANPAAVLPGNTSPDDYFTAFSSTQGTTTVGLNNVYATSTPYLRPAGTAKYIAGHNSNGSFVTGGSYLISSNISSPSTGVVGAAGDYYYAMDYRIVPGLPAIFPNASTLTLTDGGNNNNAGDLTVLNGAGSYAQPGVYTMNVKYVLIEN